MTVPASMGSVISGVRATGVVQHVDRVSIGFPEGGKVTAIKVKVGDKVKPGQPIAEVDNAEEKLALRKAKNQVTIDRAALDALVNSYQRTYDQDEVDKLSGEQDLTHKYRRTLVGGDETRVGHVKRRLDFDESEYRRISKRATDHAECLNDPGTVLEPGPTQECKDLVESDKDGVAAQKAIVLATRGELNDIRKLRQFDNVDSQLTVSEKNHEKQIADNTQKLNARDKQYAIAGARAQLDNSLADLEPAQAAYNESMKPSAYWGTVDGINGHVGTVMNAAYSTGGGSSAKTGSLIGTNLITLKDVDAYQVVVSVPQSEGQKLSEAKSVDVTFDEIPGLISSARVASLIPPAPGDKSGHYVVTAVLDDKDKRLADGQHANLNVAMDRVDNVLTVPASAVTVNGRTGMVSVKGADGSVKDVSVELGQVGNDSVEIISGIKEGDQVVEHREP